MTAARITLLYVLFAVAAGFSNLAIQRVVMALLEGPASFPVALVMGTLVGLVVKYVLDKRWIFAHRTTSLREESRNFTLYSLMAVVTTLFFWGTEALFWYIWQTDLMRELGAALGLTVGYCIKYQLDKRFVFVTVREGGAS